MTDETEYKLAFLYGGVVILGWLGVIVARWRERQGWLAEAASQQNADLRKRIIDFSGSLQIDSLYALVVVLVLAFVLFKLGQATWNSWDWATAVLGSAATLSFLLLCARGRVMTFIPFSLVPLWILLYRPGVKRTCGVPVRERSAAPTATAPEPDAAFDPKQEQAELIGLQQSLQVFELERSMDTATFMDRYSAGLEDDTPDNEEWFALGRLARRSQERLASYGSSRPTNEEQA